MKPPLNQPLTYFMFDGEFIKIGKSKSVESAFERIASIQTGNPREVSLIGVTCEEEHALHRFFSEERIRGEWFRVSSKLLKYISQSVHYVSQYKKPNGEKRVTIDHFKPDAMRINP